jgi:predicted RNA-binding protein with PIN domain
MRYWIDGYNLLFKLPALKGSLEEKRRALIIELNRQAKHLNLQITVVFDAADPHRSLDLISHYDALEIIYTTSRSTADESILHAIETTKNPINLCIVTSDKDLAHKAKNLGAQTLSLADFLKRLAKKQKNKRAKPPVSQDSPRQIERLTKIFEKKLQESQDFF